MESPIRGNLASVRRWSVLVVALLGCARGDNDIDPSPVTLAPSGSGASEGSTDPTTASDTTATGDDSESTTGAPATSTTPTETTDATTDGSGACAPLPTDDACFMCAKDHCCLAVTECELDLVCNCTIDCIAQGGMATPCSENCGGMTPATSNLVGCAAIHCMIECEGI